VTSARRATRRRRDRPHRQRDAGLDVGLQRDTSSSRLPDGRTVVEQDRMSRF
jgi:hypothetical protein